MKNVIQVAERFEDMAWDLENFQQEAANDNVEFDLRGGDVANDNVESVELLDISEAIRVGVRKAKEVTGIDNSDAKVDDLPGDIAGQYNLMTKGVTMDDGVLESGDAELVEHVFTHESWHKVNKARGDREVIRDYRVEEVLTEAATAETTGKVIAYEEFEPIVAEIASLVDVTKGQMVELFKKGENGEINDLIDQTEEMRAA